MKRTQVGIKSTADLTKLVAFLRVRARASFKVHGDVVDHLLKSLEDLCRKAGVRLVLTIGSGRESRTLLFGAVGLIAGAATGAVLGGPTGAVVGGVVGAVVGAYTGALRAELLVTSSFGTLTIL